MADINQLIEPITPSNTVNSINIYKVDYLPNVFDANPKDLRLFKEQSPRKIKGKKFDDKYVLTDPKIGQLKIKQFVSSTLKSHWGLVSKAVKIKNTVSLNTENDKYLFVLHASKEDLKKIKYDNYFGIRVSNTDLYDFDRRMVYHDIKRNPDDDSIVIIDRNNAEPMIDLSKYKNVFIDKNNFKPILRYYIDENYEEDIPEFVGKQQDGVTGSMILPNTDNTPKQIPAELLVQAPVSDSETLASSYNIEDDENLTNKEDSLTNKEDNLTNKEDSLTNKEDNLTNKEDSLTNKKNQQKTFFQRLAEKEKITFKDLKDARIGLDKEKRKIEKDIKKTIVRYVDKYVNFAAANELNNIEDIDYIIDAFNEYTQDENLKINKRSIDAVNRRIDKLRDFESTYSQWLKIPTDYWDKFLT